MISEFKLHFPIFSWVFHHPLSPFFPQENSMTIDDAWDSVEAPIWVPQVRVAAQESPIGISLPVIAWLVVWNQQQIGI
jgi:hypothetical protein